nr:HEPN domain-containing protein [uncultured Methanoregula sp.]
MTDMEVSEKLQEIVKLIKKIIQAQRDENKIHPEFEYCTHWEPTSYSYDDRGIHVDKSGTQISKPSWHIASHTISEIIKETDEYTHLLQFLKTKNIGEENQRTLSSFISKIVINILNNQDIPDQEIDKLIDRYLLDVMNKPIKSGAIIQLVGIILQPDSVELSHEITIRKPRKEDFFLDIPAFGYDPEFHLIDPTAFIEISMFSRNPREIHESIVKTMTILRLFKTGSVKYTTYQMYTDSFSNLIGGRTFSGDKTPAFEIYVVRNDLVPNLKKFYEKISAFLPSSLFKIDIGRIDHISIAYHRYSDSLLNSDIIERRITNAIMGLEALYFKPSGEQQELQYRLGIRVAKILGKLSYDPLKVRCTIKDAYSIRSIFSHGGHLGYKERRKFETKYNGDVKNLLSLVLDFLRISIIVSITIHSEKDEFIDNIDRALIDDDANEKLNTQLSISKNILME